MKFNNALRDKLVHLFDCQGYRVRFEKGNFKGGECLLEQQRLVVINKFYPLEAQINLLIELLSQIAVEDSRWDDDARAILAKLPQPAQTGA